MSTLVKQSLSPELDAMERQFRRLIGGMPLMPAFVTPAIPAADVYETPGEFVVELEVPGYVEKELSLELFDHTLAVKGIREETKAEEKSYRLHERLEQRFERTFVLPQEVDGEHITAAFEKGVLKVKAPKLATTKPRKIAISKP